MIEKAPKKGRMRNLFKLLKEQNEFIAPLDDLSGMIHQVLGEGHEEDALSEDELYYIQAAVKQPDSIIPKRNEDG